MEMEDQYNIADLRQLMNGPSGLDADTGCLGGDAATGRWPRQETLTLLEIRSRLDPKFKEANQKGPLWDEVSRIMSEEHGYQRSGKKCREKFENLYKYYKKTKEGKAGRQDGKHYRFFRQLEALYGETSNTNSVPESHFAGHGLRFHTIGQNITQANQDGFQSQKHCDSLSLSNSSEYGTSSSDDNDLSTAAAMMENDSGEKRRKRRGRSWKGKIKDFIDSQMRNLIEKQEAWLEKLMNTLEQKEQERMLKEEEWRKEEAARIEKEHKFWAKERSWIEARDAALMEALQKLTGSEVKASSSEALMAAEIQNQSENQNEDGSEILNNNGKGESWPESEIMRLMQFRNGMELRFRQSVCSEEALWEEIAGKMACLGYDRSALMYKDKWERINNCQRRSKEGYKKRKENSRSCGYFQNNESSLYNQGGAYCEMNEQEPETVRLQGNNDGSSPSNSNAGNSVHESCFPFLMADGENLWENYGLKLNKGNHNQ
nr:trihelix transcription factor ptl [Quercus suber]